MCYFLVFNSYNIRVFCAYNHKKIRLERVFFCDCRIYTQSITTFLLSIIFIMAFLRSCFYFNRCLGLDLKNSYSFLSGRRSNYVLQAKYFRSEANPKVESRLKKRDGVEDNYAIIYRAPYEMYCKVCYGLSFLSCSVFPGMISYFTFSQGIGNAPVHLGNFPIHVGNFEIGTSNWEILLYTGTLAVFIVHLVWIVFRYPYRIYRSKTSNDYLFVFQHLLPWKGQLEPMKAGEITKYTPKVQIYPWDDSLYTVNQRKAIILDYNFGKPSYFHDMFEHRNDNVKN